MANIEERVEQLIKSRVEKIGYDLYDVEYVKEGKNYYLRIYIDNEKGITLEDCEKVNNEITDLLDESDYIKEMYYLEVSSPGVERIIRKDKHLEQNIGNEIEVKLFQKGNNKTKECRGILKKYDAEKITIENEETIEIERKNIAQIKKAYKWE